MNEVVMVSTARTPIGKAYRGSLNATHAPTLGAHAVRHAVERAGIEPDEVEDVLMGCGRMEGTAGENVARQVALRAGLPVTVSGVTVNRLCSSGLQTIAMGARDPVRRSVDRSGGRSRYDLVRAERAHESLHGPGSLAGRPSSVDLPDDARHGGSRRDALRHRPRTTGRVRAAQPAARARSSGTRPVRGRNRADRSRAVRD